jgi:hypothetical protein
MDYIEIKERVATLPAEKWEMVARGYDDVNKVAQATLRNEQGEVKVVAIEYEEKNSVIDSIASSIGGEKIVDKKK